MPRKMKMAIIIVLILTCIAAVVHINNQKSISCMVIRWGGMGTAVGFENLYKTECTGELVNRKGTVTAHTYTGGQLRDLLTNEKMDMS